MLVPTMRKVICAIIVVKRCFQLIFALLFSDFDFNRGFYGSGIDLFGTIVVEREGTALDLISGGSLRMCAADESVPILSKLSVLSFSQFPLCGMCVR